MHRLLALALAGSFGIVATSAFAQTAAPQQKAPAAQTAAPAPAAPAAKSAAPAPAANPQQERMKECNVKAEGKKGDERKAFMSSCLSGKEPVKMTQQEKMTACNKKAGDMKGDERKKFMSECLKG
jgi:hypothetical protein